MQVNPIVIFAFGKHDIFAILGKIQANQDLILEKLSKLEQLGMSQQEDFETLQAKVDALGAGLDGLGATIVNESNEVKAYIADLKAKIDAGEPIDLPSVISKLDGFIGRVADYGAQVGSFVEVSKEPAPEPQPEPSPAPEPVVE